jgi:serine protease Do
MLRKCLFPLIVAVCVALCAPGFARADTIQLKDKASTVTGKILAEKRDQVAVDIGYTVLVIPRNQIASISKADTAEPKARRATARRPAPDADSKLTEDPVPEEETPMARESRSGFYTSLPKTTPALTVRDLVVSLGEAVVQVRTPGGLGSGFIINEEGYLITNFHVIEGETQISVEVYHQKDSQLDRKSYKQVRIVAMNKFADLALLKIDDKDAPRFKSVPIGSSDALGVGERVFAIGSPLGLERTVTEGILSTKTRQMAGELYLQTTTQINPGNSGGPLFNLSGEVVGVTNMKITFGEGLGFAIPAEAVRFFLDHRDAYAYSNENPSNAYRYLEPPSRTRRAESGTAAPSTVP